jgi:uncharacterized protein (TIGR02646 family)
MRRIIKGQEPEELRRWKENEVPQNLTYDNMTQAAKEGVKRQMLSEQGYLCAYTMQRIPTIEDCQIEHVVARSQDPLLQISYSNLLACAPSNRPGHRPHRGKCPFGAEQKNQTQIDENNFVSPLQEDVEHRFRYAADGSVAHVDNDGAAASTITILRLDHEQLVDLRKAAIEERVFPDLEEGLSSEVAEDLSRAIMTPDGEGRLPEFCVAISHVAAWYANRVGNGN